MCSSHASFTHNPLLPGWDSTARLVWLGEATVLKTMLWSTKVVGTLGFVVDVGRIVSLDWLMVWLLVWKWLQPLHALSIFLSFYFFPLHFFRHKSIHASLTSQIITLHIVNAFLVPKMPHLHYSQLICHRTDNIKNIHVTPKSQYSTLTDLIVWSEWNTFKNRYNQTTLYSMATSLWSPDHHTHMRFFAKLLPKLEADNCIKCFCML